jgi:hypothetical protein
MSSELGFNLGPKEHAILAKRVGRENPQAETEAAAVQRQGEVRDSGVQWEKVSHDGGREEEVRVARSDSVSFGATTVTTAEAVSAPTAPLSLRDNLRGRLAASYEKACELSFHFNRLTAKVGEFMEQVSAPFLPLEERMAIKERVRHSLIEQNFTAYSQVVYDETMLEIVT